MIASLQALIAREQEQDGRERTAWERALELERQATGLAQREMALERERAEFYESAYKLLMKKKPGVGCWLKRIFTLGIARCGG